MAEKVSMQKTCKFPADIARAWGCRVYEKGGLQKKQLAPVIAVLAREDFPKAVRGRRQRDEVVAWGSAFVTLSKDKRKITIADYSEAASRNREELPGAKKPADTILPLPQKTLAEKLKPFSPDYQKRVLNIYQLYLIGKDTRDQRKELEQWGIIDKLLDGEAEVGQKASAKAGDDDIYGGQKAVANFINGKYAGRIHTDSGFVSKMTISNWQRGEWLPELAKKHNDFFPAPHESNRYSKRSVSRWMEAYALKGTESQPSLPGAAVAPMDTEEAIRLKRLEFLTREVDIYKQSTDKKYILCSDAQLNVTGALKKHHVFVKKNLEQGLRAGLLNKIHTAGFSAEQLAVIETAALATGREIVSAIELDCEQA